MAVTLDNLLKQSFGGMYTTGGTGTQNTNATPGVYDKITQFDANGAHSDLVVPDHTNDQIQVLKSGIWLCMYNVTFDPGSSDTYSFQVFYGPAAATGAGNTIAATKIQAPNDYTSVIGFGFITLSTYDYVQLKVACNAASKAVGVKEMNLILARFSGA